MVKGVARRVIMVNSPEPKLFEQAMFLVREDAFARGSPDQVLREAEQIAKSCLQRPAQRSGVDWSLPVFGFLCGGGVASLIWAAALLF